MNHFQIGDVTLRNPIAMAPMISNLANPDGSTNEAHIEYLARRALGGVGMIITEYTYIDGVNSRGSRNELGAHSELFLPKLRRLTDRVHSFGTPIFIQLVHSGGKALQSLNAEKNFAPSAVEYNGITPNEMTQSDIVDAEERFLRAAILAKKSGFDGIELHGAHGYLIQEFISPFLNRRNDKYGGTLENSIRFPQEIIELVRSEIDIPVGIRLSLYEDDANGYGPDYGLQVADSLKNIDYVHFSAGRFATPGSTASFYHSHTHVASRLPRKSMHPTMVVGSVTTPEDVDRILAVADFVSVGRALLADPFFATKYLNKVKGIRPCIRCNQGCRNLSYGEVRCTVNPDTGFESVTDIFRRPISGEIQIVGGGIKGMEASVYAAKLGLNVTLHEKEDKLGGQLNLIFDRQKKSEFEKLIMFYKISMEKLGVVVELNSSGEKKGIFCQPDITYPNLDAKDEIRIDSNVYRYHDEALKLSGFSQVLMTERSLSSLDRDRQIMFKKMAESSGVKFVRELENPDISLIQESQYDIMSAVQSGRNSVRFYLLPRISEYT